MPKMKQAPLPFHKDLNGYERVTLPFARKTWTWGLPIRLDAGRGAVLLKKPDIIPEDGPKDAFDDACLAAMGLPSGTPFTVSLKRKCTFLLPWGVMGIHFEFEDGSNPFLKYGTAVELMPELYAWSRRWLIGPVAGKTDAVSCFRLREKDPVPGLFAPGP